MPLLTLRDTLADHRDGGMRQDEAMALLEWLRVDVGPQHEDTVLDLMDLVCGFCTPKWALWPRPPVRDTDEA